MHTQRYKINGQELEHVFVEKDLGVKVDSALRFEEHISKKAKKTNTMVGLIRQSFSFLDCKLFLRNYIQPLLDRIWSTHNPSGPRISLSK